MNTNNRVKRYIFDVRVNDNDILHTKKFYGITKFLNACQPAPFLDYNEYNAVSSSSKIKLQKVYLLLEQHAMYQFFH
jgi:hypothetical protein